jgi:hypothetical protein
VSWRESHDPARDEESLGWLIVTRSFWRNTVGVRKTAKSKALVPGIPQLAQRLDRLPMKPNAFDYDIERAGFRIAGSSRTLANRTECPVD